MKGSATARPAAAGLVTIRVSKRPAVEPAEAPRFVRRSCAPRGESEGRSKVDPCERETSLSSSLACQRLVSNPKRTLTQPWA